MINMIMETFMAWIKLREGLGVGPYIGNCVDTDTYQVLGACSDQNSEKKNQQIRKGNVSHKKIKKHSDKYSEQNTVPEPVAKPVKWKATKDEIMSYWQTLRPDQPLFMKPIAYDHTGSTYSEDGIRITGSPQFIASVMARIKDVLKFDNVENKLSVTYRETESPSQDLSGIQKTSYVFYVQARERGKGRLSP